MLRQKTLLILGAGSSRDFNFPLGPQLTDEIADAVTFDLSTHRPAGGHDVMRFVLEQMQWHQPQLYNAWLSACDYIRRNIHSASSVDRFIESNRNDSVVATICKFAIALIIADCEKNSLLGETSDHGIGAFDFRPLKSSWTTKLFHHLHAGVSLNELDTFFNQVRVVTFNYDRVFERYLMLAISNFYRVPLSRAQESASSLGLVHVYGSLGGLAQGLPEFKAFGTFGTKPEEAAVSIRTFHESASSEIAQEVGDYIQWAERVFVLGFSYADMNTDFLAQCAPATQRVRPVYGTCFQMSDQNIDVARTRMDGIFALQSACTRMLNVDCPTFIDDLALTI